MNKVKTWFKNLSVVSRVAVISAAAILFLGAIGATAQPNSSPITSEKTSVPATKVEVKTETSIEKVPYKTTTINDDTLDSGASQVRTAGVDGEVTHTYKVTYTDGRETARSGPVDTTTKQSIDEIKVVGTRVPAPTCPNGTYVNGSGNTVCSPYVSSSVPVGASAQCADGTYSFSQSRRGTCSHHGGVSVWY